MKFIKEWWLSRKRKKQLAAAPKNLFDAIKEMDKKMTDESRSVFAKEPADHPGAKYHFFGGMAMRNNWGLWDKEQPLTKWFRAQGVWHADDMSAIIYKAYWCYLNDVPFRIEDEAKYYETFWKRSGLGFDGEEINK